MTNAVRIDTSDIQHLDQCNIEETGSCTALYVENGVVDTTRPKSARVAIVLFRYLYHKLGQAGVAQ